MPYYCPNCDKEIEKDTTECPHCAADFTALNGWRPSATPPAPVAVVAEEPITAGAAVSRFLLRLVGAVVLVIILFVIAMFVAYFYGGGWFGVPYLVAVFLLLWVIKPLVRLFEKK